MKNSVHSQKQQPVRYLLTFSNMSACAKTKAFTDHFWNNRSLQLDHSNLKLNPVVKAVRALHDSLKDALYNGGLSERYNVWKRTIKWPELISQADFDAKMANGLITHSPKESPASLLFTRIKKAEKNLLAGEKAFDFNKQWGLIDYENIDPEIKEFFSSTAEFHQYMDSRYSLYQTLQNTGIDLRKYYAISNAQSKDFALNLLKDLETNETLAIMTHFKDVPATKFDDYEKALTESMWNEVPTPLKTDAQRKEVEALAKDMLFQSHSDNQLVQLMEQLHHAVRKIVIPLKYTIGVTAGQVLLVSNTVMGAVQLFARSKWLESIINSDLIKLLQDDAGILKSEMRLDANVEFGEGWIDTLGSMVANIRKNNETLNTVTKATARVLQWGWHNIWDLASDAWAKRTALAEAMAEMGIDGYNIKDFERQYKAWNMMPNLLDEIRVRAHDKYSAFYTNSKTASRTTNRFSSSIYLPFNFMQGYTMKRAAQIITSVTELSNAIKIGKVTDIKSFKRWIDGPDGGELRNLIMTSLIAGKVAVYVETNQSENQYLPLEQRLDKIKNYMYGLNDYVNAGQGSLLGRLITNTIKYGTSEYVYVDAQWNAVTEYGGIPWATLWFLEEMTNSMYREFNVFALAPTLLNGMRTSVWFDFAIEATDKELGRVINGIGRYSLSPGTEIYGMKPYPEEGDDVSDWLMIKNETNQSMKLADKLRTTEDISQFIDAPGEHTWKYLMKNLVPFKVAGKFFNTPQDINKEAAYELFQKSVERDPVAQDFYNGVFNADVLYTAQEAMDMWKPELSNVDWLYKSLTAFNNIEMWNDTLMKLGSEYGISDGTFDAIMQKLIEDVGPQTYQAMVVETNPKIKDRQAAILQATAEAKLPWAGRMMLWFIANKEYMAELKTRYNVTDDRLISPIARENLQKAIIAEYGNQLMLTDKYAQVEYLGMRAKQLHPGLINENPDLSRVVNSTMLTDMLIHQSAKKGDLNARYLGSVLSLAGKYMPDNLRLPIIEKTFFGIDKMNISENAKNVLKTGVWLWNVDFIGKIAKDPVLGKKYGSTVDNVLNLIYNTQEANSKHPNPLALDTNDFDKKTGKAYGKWAWSYGSFKKDSKSIWAATNNREEPGDKNVQDNATAREILSKKLVWLAPFKRNKVINLTSHNVDSYKNSPKNPLAEFYVKTLESQKQSAESKKLDNSVDVSKLSQIPKPHSAKIGYKSKKWTTAKLVLPKAKKLKPITYKW